MIFPIACRTLLLIALTVVPARCYYFFRVTATDTIFPQKRRGIPLALPQDKPPLELTPKQIQFNAAMDRYNSLVRYRLFGTCISILNVSLQIFLLFQVMPLSIGPGWQIFSLLAAVVLTDFINGLVHMYMDGNDRYDSLAGPLIANFHLHHKRPQYRRNNLLVVYFIETGSKVWLAGYLPAVAVCLPWLHPVAAWILVYTGILSSYAEVSHYLCHTSSSPLSMFLARLGLVLSKRRHARHHLEDNTSYTFLNGCTDPLVNMIAGRFYPGYKHTTDLHYVHYVIEGTEGR